MGPSPTPQIFFEIGFWENQIIGFLIGVGCGCVVIPYDCVVIAYRWCGGLGRCLLDRGGLAACGDGAR